MRQLAWTRIAGRIPGAFVRQVVMVTMSLVALFPLYFMAVNTLKTQQEYYTNKLGPPASLYLGNFQTVFEAGEISRWFLNSLIVTVGSVTLSTIIAALAAFAFAKMDFSGRRSLFNLTITLMVVPPVVVVIPLFVVMANLQLVNSYTGTILVYTGLIVPFSLYILYNFFRTVPSEIIEAGLIDGCSSFGLLTRILLPLSTPAIATVIAVNAIWVWNEMLIAIIFMQVNTMKTIMVGLTVYQGRYLLNVPLVMSGLIVGTLPMILMYIVSQRYLVRGLVAGALKG